MTQEAKQQIISLLKLSSGDEVITEIVVESLEGGQEVVHMVNPCTIVRQAQDDGTVSAEFTPIAVFYANGTIQVSPSQIVWSGAPVDEFKAVYLKRFAPQEETLIEAPKEKKLIVPASAKRSKAK